MANTETRSDETRTEWRDARWIQSQTGLSLPQVYNLWREAASELDIPPYGCLRPHEADALLLWIGQNSPKARRKLENLLKRLIVVSPLSAQCQNLG